MTVKVSVQYGQSTLVEVTELEIVTLDVAMDSGETHRINIGWVEPKNFHALPVVRILSPATYIPDKTGGIWLLSSTVLPEEMTVDMGSYKMRLARFDEYEYVRRSK